MLQVMIWDDHQGRCIGELNFRTQVLPHSPPGSLHVCASRGKCSACHSDNVHEQQYRDVEPIAVNMQVRAVRLRRDKIVVALEHKVLMYNFADLRLEHSTETASNPKGLVSLSAAPEHNVVACPGLHCGQVSASCSLQYGSSACDCGNRFIVKLLSHFPVDP